MTTNKYLIYSLFFTLSLGFSSCQKFTKTINDTLSGKPTEVQTDGTGTSSITKSDEEKETVFMSDRAALKKAEDQFRDLPELRGKKIMIYQTIHFYAGHRISLKIQNPDVAEYADSYSYSDGKWEGPEPIVLSKKDDIRSSLVDLDRIPFVNANNVYEAMVEKLNEIGRKSTDFTVYISIYKNKPKWYPRSLSNERSRYSIEFNEDGTLQSFEQD